MLDSNKNLPNYSHRPGNGPALVFLHYWGGSSRTWTPVIDRLSDRETVAIDARGWSSSRELAGPYSIDQAADDTLAVIADAGISDYVLVGHSIGGKVAQLVGARQPAGLRGLVLVAPAPARPATSITPDFQARLAHAYDSDEAVAEGRDHVLTASALPTHLARQVVEDSRAVGEEALREWPQHGIAEDVSEFTAQIRVPVLVIAGENDKLEPAAVLRENLLPFLDEATLTVVPGSGHLIPLEAPDALAAAIADFPPLG